VPEYDARLNPVTGSTWWIGGKPAGAGLV